METRYSWSIRPTYSGEETRDVPDSGWLVLVAGICITGTHRRCSVMTVIDAKNGTDDQRPIHC